MSINNNLVSFFITVGIFVVLFQYIYRFIYKYELKEDSLNMVFLNFICLRKIYYKEIIKIKKVSSIDGMFSDYMYNFMNRLWGECYFLIINHKGQIKQGAITPDNAKEFIEELRKRCNLDKIY